MDSLNIKWKLPNILVNVEFHDKINLLYDDSGTGKSYMFTLIKTFCDINGKSCIFINYNNSPNFSDNKSQIAEWCSMCKHYDIILLDNADIYLTPDILEELSENYNGIILISIKKLDGYCLDCSGVYTTTIDNGVLSNRKIL